MLPAHCVSIAAVSLILTEDVPRAEMIPPWEWLLLLTKQLTHCICLLEGQSCGQGDIYGIPLSLRTQCTLKDFQS